MSRTKVFISHSFTDREWVSRFAKLLEDRGIDTWLDIWSLSPGEPFIKQLEAALRGSDVIVAILAPGESVNPNILFEMGVALGMKKRLLPIVSANADSPRLPSDLAGLMSIARGTPEETAEVVSSAIARQLTATDRSA